MPPLSLPMLMALISSGIQLVIAVEKPTGWLLTLLQTILALMAKFNAVQGPVAALNSSHVNNTIMVQDDIGHLLWDFPKDHINSETVEKWAKELHDQLAKTQDAIPRHKDQPVAAVKVPGAPPVPEVHKTETETHKAAHEHKAATEHHK